ncbi:RNA-binding S4 domain-containing protein [Rhodobium orientis]|uniref:RNA-binding protein n=1 Tax=Rhodobium orientis TaxID=34017 RepID=A0A327JHT8_9HYPH|nr:RNA-binding S4 domain-containing protein [Rhodobium orientis]MBK5950939.1 RNA-binding protein [Rhodobium orientis]RAI23881.1 RNA-binding protein [Rhodobium orientis]
MAADAGPEATGGVDTGTARLRIDKWLWFARVVKTRTLAQKLAVSGRVRKNREKISSASATVKPGDVLTITLERQVKVLRILGLGERRGPAPEAQKLYEDLSPPVIKRSREERPLPPGQREHGAGRPTKRERRRIDAFRHGEE